MHALGFSVGAEHDFAMLPSVARRDLMLGAVALGLAGAGCRVSSTVDLWLGGDLHLGDGGPVLARALVRSLRGASGVVNLEGAVAPVSRCASQAEAICLANEEAALMARAGIDVMGIANNHAHDLGVDAPLRTSQRLRALGFGVAGGPAGAAIIVRGGRGVAVTAHDLGQGVPAGLADELRAARRLADDLVATFHVTGPPSLLPRPELVTAADQAIAAGARVVVGHGSHALGPVERRGETVIAWGLGNLRFACDCTDERDALILRVALGHGPVQATIVPIDAGLGGAAARPSSDAAFTFEVLAALGSSPIERQGAVGQLL
jgi:Bacterial capsule synthesis protein PGA_cap